MRPRRILVTGGAGFIGSSVVDACLAEGHDVAVVDDLSSGSSANVADAARLYRVDIRSSELHDVFCRERPEIVSHHAAQISVSRSVANPMFDAAVNVLGSLNVLEASRRHGVRRVVFASSGGAIYGEPDRSAADERHPCRPRSPYAVAKLAVEHYLASYGLTTGLETVVLRYANVYGPRQDPRGEAGVVVVFIDAIRAERTPVIYGDGEQVRDFVYVGDVARANAAAHTLTLASGEPVVVNIGTGRGTSVNALWRALAAIAESSLEPDREPARAGDLVRSVLDPRRAHEVMGWTPQVDLGAGLRRTWDWFSGSTWSGQIRPALTTP
jgi:UDP-glucose 4-epimerase